MERSDVHRPAAFDPADYRVVDYLDNRKPEPPHPSTGAYGDADAMAAYQGAVRLWQARIFEHFPDWRTGGGDHVSIYQCNHCGHPAIRWVAVVEHVPTGAKLAFGEICADRCELPGRDAFRAKFIKDRAAREQAAYEKEQERIAFLAANAAAIAFLQDVHEGAIRIANDFLDDMVRRWCVNGRPLSDAQAAAVLKFKARHDERAARRTTEAEEMAANGTEPVPTGRRTIEGEIVSVKWQDGNFPGFRMLVRENDGNRVWGTVPRALEDASDGDATALRGHRVRFTGTVKRSDRDDHFGFFARPMGAVLDPEPDRQLAIQEA